MLLSAPAEEPLVASLDSAKHVQCSAHPRGADARRANARFSHARGALCHFFFPSRYQWCGISIANSPMMCPMYGSHVWVFFLDGARTLDSRLRTAFEFRFGVRPKCRPANTDHPPPPARPIGHRRPQRAASSAAEERVWSQKIPDEKKRTCRWCLGAVPNRNEGSGPMASA